MSNWIEDAITDEGRMPREHQRIVRKHLTEWQSLWGALIIEGAVKGAALTYLNTHFPVEVAKALQTAQFNHRRKSEV